MHKTFLKNNKPKKIVDAKGNVTIPENYKWCHVCQALTPSKKAGPEQIFAKEECIVCGEGRNTIFDSCPKCSWYEEGGDLSEYDIIIIHHEGCHCQINDNDDAFLFYTHAQEIARSFKEDWLKPAPERCSYSLPKDKEWHNLHTRLMRQWLLAYEQECGCSRYFIYRNTHTFNFKSWTYPSMDCYNAQEWSYDIKCPICGTIFTAQDGNC